MRTSIVIGLVLGVFLTVVPPSAGADGPDASEEPRVSGPLVGSPVGCEDDGEPEPGTTTFQLCSWMYELIPADTSVGEDFGVYWIQMEINPSKGWCAKEMSFDLQEPEGVRLLSVVPDGGKRIKKRKASVRSLVVNGSGAALLPGSVEQDIIETPGREQVRASERRFSYRWTGNSRRKVVVALGLELAYERIPPQLFTTWFEGVSVTSGTCEPILITAERRGRSKS